MDTINNPLTFVTNGSTTTNGPSPTTLKSTLSPTSKVYDSGKTPISQFTGQLLNYGEVVLKTKLKGTCYTREQGFDNEC
jgi:hypothetical protein